MPHKLDVLRAHCQTEGRDYDSIEKTVMMPLNIGDKGENIPALMEQIRGFAALGVAEVHGSVPNVWETERLELIGREMIPAMAEL